MLRTLAIIYVTLILISVVLVFDGPKKEESEPEQISEVKREEIVAANLN
jgi:hypothetical protein